MKVSRGQLLERSLRVLYQPGRRCIASCGAIRSGRSKLDAHSISMTDLTTPTASSRARCWLGSWGIRRSA